MTTADASGTGAAASADPASLDAPGAADAVPGIAPAALADATSGVAPAPFADSVPVLAAAAVGTTARAAAPGADADAPAAGPLPAPLSDAPLLTPLPVEPLRYPLSFDGRAADYFRIWIASLALSVLTLGIYSAWGKVRKARWLYAHTKLDGSGFDYRASPLAILRGRIIALLLFGGLALGGHFLPVVQVVFVVLLLLLTPWIVVAAARFNARNSSWRNIPFGFDGRVGESAKVFVGGALLTVVTLGIAYPWYRMRRARFIVAHHRFGATPFATDFEAGGFFVTYLLAGLMVIGTIILAGLLGGLVALLAGAPESEAAPPGPGFYAVMAAVYALYIAVFGYIRARTLNLTANGTTIGSARLACTLKARRLAWLYLSNVVAILFTVGLATPWAMVRMIRYRMENLALVSNAPVEAYTGRSGEGAAATGSEVSDLFDVDVSL